MCELTQENLLDLASKTCIEELPKGKSLFKKGETDNFSYYLIQGDVAIISGTEPDKVLSGGTAQSRFPLDHHRPRQASAITQTDIRYICIDNDLLDILLTWDQNATYRVSDIVTEEQDEDNDWMTQMLRSEIFHRIPPGNIQAVFMRMEAVNFKPGANVINQGDDGDYYYFIRKGRCVVNHTSAKTGNVIKLAELDEGRVEMVRKVDAKKALKTINDFELKGKRMAVHEAKQERDRNSAGGGKNFGGRRR